MKTAALVAALVAAGANADRPVPTVVGGLMKQTSGDGHPTLSDRWTAFVQEDEVGWVYESYKMVQEPTVANPSGKWTNFTDGSCKELIFVSDDLRLTARYLLKCDAVNCCHEPQDGNHVEYQIPNVHPAALAPVTYKGTEGVEITPDQGNPYTVVADVWFWKFTLEKYYAFTINGTDGSPELLRWTVELGDQAFNNTYLNYTAPADTKAFDQQFQIPEVCHGDILPCPNAYEKGLLSEKNYKRFMRSSGK